MATKKQIIEATLEALIIMADSENVNETEIISTVLNNDEAYSYMRSIINEVLSSPDVTLEPLYPDC